MHTEVLNMAPNVPPGNFPESVLSFRPFINYLKKRKDNKDNHKAGFFAYITSEFEKYPELQQAVEVEEMYKYQGLLELIYNCLSPMIEDEEKHLWALSQPLNPNVFFSTQAFYSLVVNMSTGSLRKSIASKTVEEITENQQRFCYSIILERCYGLPGYFKHETVYSLENENTGLMHYHKMKMDTRFIEVQAKSGFPDFDIRLLQSGDNYDHDALLPLLREKLPLHLFTFEGVSIVSITDITVQYAIDNIRNSILNRASLEDEHCFYSVIHWLKTIVASNDIEFGILPVLQINNKLIFDESTCSHSVLMETARQFTDAESVYLSMAENYFKDPKRVFWGKVEEGDEHKKVYLKILKAAGVKSYALIPLNYNSTLAGVLEVYTNQTDLLTEALLALLDPVIPLLSQLLKNSIGEFNECVNQVIREKFTSLQPAVQWKFNQVAWHYIRDMHLLQKRVDIEEIDFGNVFPLYGAVDIRNSTIERNAALIRDFKVQFNVLAGVLKELKQLSGFGLIDEKIFLTQTWMPILDGPSGGNQEIRLNDFFENNIHPFLRQFAKGNPEYTRITEKYFDAIDDKTGIAFESRRQLETSMNTVISSVNSYLESMKTEIQQAYPSYFEKFRTDGVEYDIYIGQSIAPDKPFSEIYLKNLRLLQLTSMAAIAKLSHAMIEHLPKRVETTQLIFIHSSPIDIKFRTDEKRFDVEGAYNIRYHIIKKRIDKVRIKVTKERLTQPNKIAIVYFSQKEAEEQTGYIRYLQQQHLLSDDLEELELEELQGVNGLKALRVGVVQDSDKATNDMINRLLKEDSLKIGE